MCQLKMISQSRLCAVHTEYNVFILLRPGNVNIAQLQLLDRFCISGSDQQCVWHIYFRYRLYASMHIQPGKNRQRQKGRECQNHRYDNPFFPRQPHPVLPLSDLILLSLCLLLHGSTSFFATFLSGFTAHPVSAAHTGRFSQDTGLLNHSKPRS